MDVIKGSNYQLWKALSLEKWYKYRIHIIRGYFLKLYVMGVH